MNPHKCRHRFPERWRRCKNVLLPVAAEKGREGEPVIRNEASHEDACMVVLFFFPGVNGGPGKG